MSEVSIRDLRNHGGEVVDRVQRGERLTITRAGRPVARLVPVPRTGLTAETLSGRRRSLPTVDHDAPRGMLDTSTVVLLGRISDASTLPDEPLISAVTLAELSVGPLVAATDQERQARQAHLQQAEADFDPLPFDAAAARAFGQVAASLRRAGRRTSARSYDAMIAAVAIANGLALFTCNPTDFAGIDGLELRPVPVPPT